MLYLLTKLFKINMQLYLINVKFFSTSVLISTYQENHFLLEESQTYL